MSQHFYNKDMLGMPEVRGVCGVPLRRGFSLTAVFTAHKATLPIQICANVLKVPQQDSGLASARPSAGEPLNIPGSWKREEILSSPCSGANFARLLL